MPLMQWWAAKASQHWLGAGGRPHPAVSCEFSSPGCLSAFKTSQQACRTSSCQDSLPVAVGISALTTTPQIDDVLLPYTLTAKNVAQDEPTSGLDSTSSRLVVRALQEVSQLTLQPCIHSNPQSSSPQQQTPLHADLLTSRARLAVEAMPSSSVPSQQHR